MTKLNVTTIIVLLVSTFTSPNKSRHHSALLVTAFSTTTTTATSHKQQTVLPLPSQCSTTKLHLFDKLKNIFDTTFSEAIDTSKAPPIDSERLRIKKALLFECQNEYKTNNERKEQRKRIEHLISKMEDLSPTPNSATSSLLRKDWLLTWTTEKEINFFIDWNLSGPITQSIRGNVLNNNIPFKSGGGLGVEGSVSIPDEENNGDIDCQNRQRRTNFKFTSAVLDLDKWGKYNFPPVGEGWFDTVYLDEDLRVDINSRNDILVCTPLET